MPFPEEVVIEETEETFTDAELEAAADEISNQYRGIVLSHALRIVVKETRLPFCRVCELLHVSKQSVYRYAEGGPCGQHTFFRNLHLLTEIRKTHGMKNG